jgi:hypothetical protein
MDILTSLHGERIGLSKNDDLVINGQVAVPASNAKVVALTAAATITRDSHDGRLLYLNAAAGKAITLPAASGSGSRYRFVVGATVTSVGHTIKVANATDIMIGNAIVLQDGGDTLVAFETASTTDTITLDGSTTGGIIGDEIEVIDVASGVFFVKLLLSATGTEATPFSATVS